MGNAEETIIVPEITSGATVNLTAPFVATLPDGTTIALPAGTVLREQVARAALPEPADHFANARAMLPVRR